MLKVCAWLYDLIWLVHCYVRCVNVDDDVGVGGGGGG